MRNGVDADGRDENDPNRGLLPVGITIEHDEAIADQRQHQDPEKAAKNVAGPSRETRTANDRRREGAKLRPDAVVGIADLVRRREKDGREPDEERRQQIGGDQDASTFSPDRRAASGLSPTKKNARNGIQYARRKLVIATSAKPISRMAGSP